MSNELKPITREELLLAAAAGQDVTVPEPITRKEMFLAKLVNKDATVPAAITRDEYFIEAAAEARNASVIVPLDITENGTYTAPAGVDGYNPVTVAVKPVLQDKTVTENGEYTADSGFDGLGKVTVEVAGSGGGGSLPAGAYWVQGAILPAPPYPGKHFWFNGELYMMKAQSSSSGPNTRIYKYSNGSYTDVTGVITSYIDQWLFAYLQLGDKVHFFSRDGSYHYTFDANYNYTKKASLPFTAYGNTAFVSNGNLYIQKGSTTTWYKWNEADDTWSETTDITSAVGMTVWESFEYNGSKYMYHSGKLYTVINNVITEFFAIGYSLGGICVLNDFLYCTKKSTEEIIKFDLIKKTSHNVGKMIGLQDSPNMYVLDGKLYVNGRNKETYMNMYLIEIEDTE